MGFGRAAAWALLAGAPAILAQMPVATPIKPTPYFPASAFYRGATLFGTGQPVSVRFVHSKSYWANDLYFMNPRTQAAEPLFTIRETGRASLCPEGGALIRDLGTFAPDEELVFMLKTSRSEYAGEFCSGEACGPRYTGRNDPDSSAFHSRGEFAHLAGHIWAGGARLNADQVKSIADPCPGRPYGPRETTGIAMAYDDGADTTWDDYVFLVTGAILETEKQLPPPAILGESPFKDSAWVTLVPASGERPGEPVSAYTLDGTLPQVDAEGRPLGTTRTYQGPFRIGSTVTVKALSWLRDPDAKLPIEISGTAELALFRAKAGSTFREAGGVLREVPCRITVSGGGVAVGEEFPSRPQPVALPLSVIKPRASPDAKPVFLDYEWRIANPRRPGGASFPNGPEFRVASPTGFSFHLAFFSTDGQFINRADGVVGEDMLGLGRLEPDGRRSVALMWYPVSAEGMKVATGSYIVRGELVAHARGPAGTSRPPACPDTRQRVLIRFGYLRTGR